MNLLKTIFLFLFLPLFLLSNSQEITRSSTKIEIIKRRIKAAKTDTTKIKLLQQWSDLVFISDPEKDLELQQQVIDICEEHLKNEKIPYLKNGFQNKNLWLLTKLQLLIIMKEMIKKP